ncbi:MAG: hypothetical protein U0414_30930 [Polyangiaceae bacterium]
MSPWSFASERGKLSPGSKATSARRGSEASCSKTRSRSSFGLPERSKRSSDSRARISGGSPSSREQDKSSEVGAPLLEARRRVTRGCGGAGLRAAVAGFFVGRLRAPGFGRSSRSSLRRPRNSKGSVSSRLRASAGFIFSTSSTTRAYSGPDGCPPGNVAASAAWSASRSVIPTPEPSASSDAIAASSAADVILPATS